MAFAGVVAFLVMNRLVAEAVTSLVSIPLPLNSRESGLIVSDTFSSLRTPEQGV